MRQTSIEESIICQKSEKTSSWRRLKSHGRGEDGDKTTLSGPKWGGGQRAKRRAGGNSGQQCERGIGRGTGADTNPNALKSIRNKHQKGEEESEKKWGKTTEEKTVVETMILTRCGGKSGTKGEGGNEKKVEPEKACVIGYSGRASSGEEQ